MPNATVLLDTDFVRLEIDTTRRIVRFTRTAAPFRDLAMIDSTFQRIATALAHVDRSQYGLLSDVRPAPGNNDPAFEEVIVRHRADLFRGFARRAGLVKTLVGSLQVQRLNRQQHETEMRVFQEESDAIAYLTRGR
jgi:hypothetical protein